MDRAGRFAVLDPRELSRHDVADQLTVDGTNGFSYDETGNRTNSGHVTGTGNRIETDGVRTYTFDANGNLSQSTVGAAGATWVYGYDHRNQLTSAAYSATDGGAVTQRVTYTLDAFGNRIAREAWDGSTTVTERYGLDGWDTAKPSPIGNEQFDAWVDLDGSNALVTRRIYGPDFDAVMTRQSAAGVVAWYLPDRQGSVRTVIDNSAAVQNSTIYSAYGVVTGGSLGDRFGFTGQEYDPITGMWVFNARIYDPTTGRFLQVDPLSFAAGDPNLFRYVGNSPTNATDPSGMDVFDRIWGEIKQTGNGIKNEWEGSAAQNLFNSALQKADQVNNTVVGFVQPVVAPVVGPVEAWADQFWTGLQADIASEVSWWTDHWAENTYSMVPVFQQAWNDVVADLNAQWANRPPTPPAPPEVNFVYKVMYHLSSWGYTVGKSALEALVEMPALEYDLIQFKAYALQLAWAWITGKEGEYNLPKEPDYLSNLLHNYPGVNATPEERLHYTEHAMTNLIPFEELINGGVEWAETGDPTRFQHALGPTIVIGYGIYSGCRPSTTGGTTRPGITPQTGPSKYSPKPRPKHDQHENLLGTRPKFGDEFDIPRIPPWHRRPPATPAGPRYVVETNAIGEYVIRDTSLPGRPQVGQSTIFESEAIVEADRLNARASPQPQAPSQFNPNAVTRVHRRADPVEIDEVMGPGQHQRFGDPRDWAWGGAREVPMADPGYPPGTMKVYEVYYSDTTRLEYHYIRYPDGTTQPGHVESPGRTVPDRR